MDSDSDAEAFFKLLTDLNVPDQLQQALQDSGVSSIADYAYAYNSTADLSHFIASVPPGIWQDLSVQDPEHCPASARLRRALDKCKSITQAADHASLPAAMATSSSAPQGAAFNVWAEHAPPRLDSEAVSKLVDKFKQNYPSEHLDSDTRPSIRLLSLVRQWFRPRGTGNSGCRRRHTKS